MKRAIQTVRGGKVWMSEGLRDSLVNHLAGAVASEDLAELVTLSDRGNVVFRLMAKD